MGYSFRLTARLFYMHHPTDRIAHTTAFVTPVMDHWLEWEIAQWVHPTKDRSDDPSHHERTLLPRSYISLRIFIRRIKTPSQLFATQITIDKNVLSRFLAIINTLLCTFIWQHFEMVTLIRWIQRTNRLWNQYWMLQLSFTVIKFHLTSWFTAFWLLVERF